MTVLRSFDLNGKKLSFANWIINLSPQETPFLSMIKKEKVDQTVFQWQTDHLNKPGENAMKEGSESNTSPARTTALRENYTQIFRKVVKVSKTANKVSTYGKGSEFHYQMEKAGKELKRDIEWAFLRNLGGTPELPEVGRVTAGFHAQVAPLNTPDPYTGANVHKVKNSDNVWGDMRDLAYELYMAGAHPTVMMVHPSNMIDSALLQEINPNLGPNITANRIRLFENTEKVHIEVNQINDPWGQQLKLVPNRYMPLHTGYIFNPDDWTCMVLREPTAVKLDSDGSYEKWMIECEMGLRLSNPYAAGIFDANSLYHRSDVWGSPVFCGFMFTDAFTGQLRTIPMNAQTTPEDISEHFVAKAGTPLAFWGKANDNRHVGAITVDRNATNVQLFGFRTDEGKPMCVPDGLVTQPTSYAAAQILIPSLSQEDAGIYTIELITELNREFNNYDASITRGLRLAIKADGDDIIFPPV